MTDKPSDVPARILRIPCTVWALLMATLLMAPIMAHFEPAITAVDANGYWAQGSLMAQHGAVSFEMQTEADYIGMHWLLAEDGRYHSHYPPGLGSVVAVAYTLFGWQGSVLVNPLLAWLALVGLYKLAAQVTTPRWGLVAIPLLASLPLFGRHALQCDSHMMVAALLAWGLFLLLAWQRRGGWGRALTAGLLLGTIPAVRYPEAVYGLAIGLFLLSLARRSRGLRDLALAGAGAALPILLLGVYNLSSFGSFWRTAYSLTNEQTGFTWAALQQHAGLYLESLQSTGAAIPFALALPGLALMLWHRTERRTALLLLGIAVPTLLLYMAYYWSPMRGEGGIRFILPVHLLLCVPAVFALRQLTVQAPRAAAVTAATLVVVAQIATAYPASMIALRRESFQRGVLALTTEELDREVPRGAVLISSGKLLQHLDFVRHWHLVQQDLLTGHAPRMGRRGMQTTDRPSPMQWEKQAARTERLAGLSSMQRQKLILDQLKDVSGDRGIYFIGSRDDLAAISGIYLRASQFEIVTEIDLPAEPIETARRRPFQGLPGAGGPDAPGGPGQAQGFPPGGDAAAMRRTASPWDARGNNRPFPGRRDGMRPGGGDMRRLEIPQDGHYVIARWNPGAASAPTARPDAR